MAGFSSSSGKGSPSSSRHMGTSSILGSDEYEVEEILDRRSSTTQPGTYDYLIRWANYSSQDNTWENERSIEAPVLVGAYDAAHPRTPPGSIMSEISDTTDDSTTTDSHTTDIPKGSLPFPGSMPEDFSPSPGIIPLSLRPSPSPAITPPSDTEPQMEVPDGWIGRIVDLRTLPSGRIRYLVQFTDDMDGEYEWRDEAEVGAYLRMLFLRGQYDQENILNPATVQDPVADQEEEEEKERQEKEEQDEEKQEKEKKDKLSVHSKIQDANKQAAQQARERKEKEREEKRKRDEGELEKKKKKVAEIRDAAKKASDPTLRPHSTRPQSVAPQSVVPQTVAPLIGAPQGNRPFSTLPRNFLHPAPAAHGVRPQSTAPHIHRSQSTVPQITHQQGTTSSHTPTVHTGVTGSAGVTGSGQSGSGQTGSGVAGSGQAGAPDPYDSSEPSSSDGSDVSENDDLNGFQGGGFSDDEKSEELSEDSDNDQGEESEDGDDRDLQNQATQLMSQSQQPQQVPAPSTPKPAAKLVPTSFNKYEKYLRNGFLPLLSHTYDDCASKHGALNQSRKMDFIPVGFRILASIPKELLEAIVDGNVALLKKNLRDHRPNDPLTKYMQKWDKRAVVQPSIYQRILVHEKTKQAPTPTDLLKVLRNLRLYGRKSRGPMERKVDSMVGNWNKDQLRYVADVEYHERELLKAKTANEKGEWAKKKQNAANRQKAFFKKVDEFCTEAERRFNRMQASMLTRPLKTPWRYIGFAKNAQERNEKQHNKHTSSSPLMMLVEAVAMHTLNEPAKSFQGPYRMDWSVITYTSAHDEATPSEIIMSVISEGYWYSGVGLGIEDSGKSNDVTDFDGKWGLFTTWTMANTAFHDNVREQNALMEAKRYARLFAMHKVARDKAHAQGGAKGLEQEARRQELIYKICANRLVTDTFKDVDRIVDEASLEARKARVSSTDDTSQSSSANGRQSSHGGGSSHQSASIARGSGSDEDTDADKDDRMDVVSED